jgi:hypothetical protein
MYPGGEDRRGRGEGEENVTPTCKKTFFEKENVQVSFYNYNKPHLLPGII